MIKRTSASALLLLVVTVWGAGCAILLGNDKDYGDDPSGASTGTSPTGSTGQGGGTNCDFGQIVCSGACVDPNIDDHHCGACGHDCLDSECNQGICTPTMIAQDSTDVGDVIAASGSWVYWGSGNDTRFVLKQGGKIESIANSPTCSMASGPTGIFRASCQGPNGSFLCGLSLLNKFLDCTPIGQNPSGSSMQPIGSITVGGDMMYFVVETWSENPKSVEGLYRMPVDYSAPPSKVADFSPSLSINDSPSLLAADDKEIFWVNPNAGEVKAIDKQGQKTRLLASSQKGPYSIAVDEDHVYWTNIAEMGKVMKVAKAGGSKPVEIASDPGFPCSIVASGDHVYWVSRHASEGAVWRMWKKGGDALKLATGQKDPRALVVDDQYVYWLNKGDNTIKKVAK